MFFVVFWSIGFIVDIFFVFFGGIFLDGVMLLVVWNLFGYDFVFFCLIVYVCCICVVLVLFVCIVIDVLFIVIVILMIDYLSCGMFDDWLCCVGYGYDCLCIDDFLCCVGYWLLCFEYLLDLFVVCDMCVFDFFVV